MKQKIQSIKLKFEAAIANIPITEACYRSSIKHLFNCIKARNKIITTGIGKAGIMAQLAAAKFSSIGAPALYIHPSDALHGDLGVIKPGDLLLIYSNSGKTDEVIKFMNYFNDLAYGSVVILITSNGMPDEKIGFINEILETGNPKEAGIFGLLPSCSIATMSVITDILVILLAEDLNFKLEHYGTIHHGGYIGETIKTQKK